MAALDLELFLDNLDHEFSESFAEFHSTKDGFFATNRSPLLYGDNEASTTPSLIMARIEV